jgi:phosphoribosylamine--glycine ligase/phosphoribosylformylglycinamidine cyclo-ligase
MVCVAKPGDAQRAVSVLQEAGETVFVVGKLVERAEAGGEGCVVKGCEKAWRW